MPFNYISRKLLKIYMMYNVALKYILAIIKVISLKAYFAI